MNYFTALIKKQKGYYKNLFSKMSAFGGSSSVRSEMEVFDAGTVLFTQSYNPSILKKNDGKAILGYIKYAGQNIFFVVGNTSNDVQGGSTATTLTVRSINYENETWFYAFKAINITQTESMNDAYALIDIAFTNFDDGAKAVLDYYYKKAV